MIDPQKIYTVLVNYNSWRETIECVKSLLMESYENFEIIVVDNKSTNESIKELSNWLKGIGDCTTLQQYDIEKYQLNFVQTYTIPVKLEGDIPIKRDIIFISSSKNIGFAGGNNIAIEYIHRKKDAHFIWLLNNDTVVKRDSIKNKVIHINNNCHKKIGVLGSKILYYHNHQLIQCIGGSLYNRWIGYSKQIGNGEIDNGQYDVASIKPDLILGASMFITRDFLNVINYLDEGYFLYFEEQDIARVARLNNFMLDYTIESIVYHKEGRTIGAGKNQGKTLFSDFYYNRSKLLFTYKHYGFVNRITVRMSMLITIFKRALSGRISNSLVVFQIMTMPIESLKKTTYEKLRRN